MFLLFVFGMLARHWPDLNSYTTQHTRPFWVEVEHPLDSFCILIIVQATSNNRLRIIMNSLRTVCRKVYENDSFSLWITFNKHSHIHTETLSHTHTPSPSLPPSCKHKFDLFGIISQASNTQESIQKRQKDQKYKKI